MLVTYSALLLSALSAVRSACPGHPWRKWKNHCYRLTKPVTWHGVRAECKSPFRQADVAIITSKHENTYIWSLYARRQNVWLGMRSHGGRRWWVDGKPVKYTNFAISSSKTPLATGAGDALQMTRKHHGTWELVSSYDPPIKLRGVCKMPLCTCPNGWKKWRNRCYRDVKQTLGWVEARQHCQRLSPTADLATITNAWENNLVARLAGGYSNTWIGLNDREHEGQYRWSGEPQRRITYKRWHKGEPNGKRHREDCVAILKDKTWADYGCHTTATGGKFVCSQFKCGIDKVVRTEKTRVGLVRVWRPENGLRCPTGWSRSGNKCFSKPTVADTFSEVQKQCAEPARLAVINSLTDNDRAFLVADTLPVWISHGDQFTHWQDDSPGKSGCVSLQESGKWLSVPCDRVQPALCQVSACTPRCPPGWSQFEGHCYRADDTKRKAKDAEEECQKSGGHLASIQNQDENDFIQTLAFPYTSKYRLDRYRSTRFVLIGASRPQRSSVWSWSDCTKWTMSRWVGIDGDLTSHDTCALMTINGRWKGTELCKEDWYRFVCKMDPCRKQFGSLEKSSCSENRPTTEKETKTSKPTTTKPPPRKTTTTKPPPRKTTTTKPLSDTCPADGRQWGHHDEICLTVSKSEPMKFGWAMKKCVIHGKFSRKFIGTLPVIRLDSRKDALLKLAAGTDVWLGLAWRASNGYWYWHDGIRARTLDWQVKPDRTRRCAAMDGKTGGLVARRCKDPLPFFCQARRM